MNVSLRPSPTRSAFRTAYSRGWSTPHAVTSCIRSIGPGQPHALIVFCGGKHDPDAVLHGVRSAYPLAPVVGGSAAGVISRDESSYSGLELGVLAIFGAGASPAVVAVDGLDRGEEIAGTSLGRQIAAIAGDDAAVMLFYDSVAASEPPKLHPAAALVSGIEAGLGSKKIRLFGGGLLTDLNLSNGWVFDGRAARKHAAVALVFPPNVAVDTTIVHGCRPASAYMTITRVNGAEILEIDDAPALEVVEAVTGLTVGGSTGQNLSLIATIGERLGDPFAPFDEDSYVNRLILNADRERGSITLFEPDFSVGSRVQIMARDNELMLSSAARGVKLMNEMIAANDEDNVALSIYIDCAGRAAVRNGGRHEEADIIRKGLNRSVPFIGFYSGVEIAPFGDRARSLDWTGVLATLRYDR